jgi:DNA replication and repair protein RecF
VPFLSVNYKNFRNLSDKSIDFQAKEIFFVGENGQGKSNILESLYFLAYGNSFRTRKENELIKYGQNDLGVSAFFINDKVINERISIKIQEGKKKIEKNGKKITDRKELINTIPAVLFCHDDLEFVSGEPEKRRFFIDQTISMNDVVYLDYLRRYKKTLKSRNIILKEKQYSMLDVYDIQLIENGIEIQKKRKNTFFLINSIFTKIYQEVSGIDSVTIEYRPFWQTTNKEEIIEILKNKREQDKILKTTTSGPHRDAIIFMRKGQPFVNTASTGQRRLAALALRIVQAVYFSQINNKKPILLMDDVLLELDPEKRKKIMLLLPEYDQLFCTYLPEEPYERYIKSKTKIYNIKGGLWYE